MSAADRYADACPHTPGFVATWQVVDVEHPLGTYRTKLLCLECATREITGLFPPLWIHALEGTLAERRRTAREARSENMAVLTSATLPDAEGWGR